MRIFFIGDLHFGHKNLLKFERTQFETIEEHDQFIIDSINKHVKLTDTLYVLGDVGNVEKVKQLNGRKILIMGNHDARSKQEYLSYFNDVYETPIYFNKRVLLSHEPKPVTQGILNVHGHLHGAYLDSKNHFNTSADLINYIPVSADLLGSKVALLEKDNERFLYEWYADMYVFTGERDDVVLDENFKIKLEESREFKQSLKQLFTKDDFEDLWD